VLLQGSGGLSAGVWEGEHVPVLQLDALAPGSASGGVGSVDKSELSRAYIWAGYRQPVPSVGIAWVGSYEQVE